MANKKINIEIKNRWTRSIIFSYETVNNTLNKTLEKAVKSDANLRGADLRGADLCGADLRGADLCGADLRGADLCGADLCGADLCGADLRGADLCGADLRNAKNPDYAIALTRIVPEGDVIGWKKTYMVSKDGCFTNTNILVKLLIPKKAKRNNAFGRKCRAEYAKVLEILDGNKKIKEAYSSYDTSFKYEVGKIVKPTKPFDEDFTNECASGIHFFITRLEAENYD